MPALTPLQRLSVAACVGLTFGSRFFRVSCDPPDRALAAGATPGTAAPGTVQQTAAPPVPQPVAAPTQAPPAAQQTAPGANPQVDWFLGQVTQRISEQLAPITQRLQTAETHLQTLSQPRSQSGLNPQSVLSGMGRAPAAVIGESSLTSRGYQLQRVIGRRQGFLTDDRCKVELDMHQRLYRMCVEQGGMVLEGNNSLLVPMSADYLPEEERQGTLANEIRQSWRQGVSGADPAEFAAMVARTQGMSVQQALSIYDDQAGGVFLGPTQQGDMIDLIRAREVFSRLGARSLPLPPNGRLSLPKQTGTGSGYWVGESQSITPSQFTTGNMVLTARKLAMLYKLPNELLRFGMPGTEAFVRNDMASTLALTADSAFFDGVGTSNRPQGLLRYNAIKTVVATTVDTNGNTLQPQDLGRVMAKIEDGNFDLGSGFGWATRAGIWWDIYNRRADAVTANDQKGPFVFAVNRNDISAGRPSLLQGYPLVTSNQVPGNRAKGTVSNLTTLLGGIWPFWLIGRVGVLEIATSTQGDTPFVTDQTWLRAIQHLDGAPMYPEAFAMIDTLVDPNRS